MRTVENEVITSIKEPQEDAIQCKGADNPTIIKNCIIDFRNVPPKDQDELVSGVNGAVVYMENCILVGGKKALLCGNGDHEEEDRKHARWTINNCAILECARRTPEAQHGTLVEMTNCWVHEYGAYRDDRSFGAWAHTGGRIIAHNTLFTQSKGLFRLGLLETIKDIGYHIGQVWNDSKLMGILTTPKLLLPGRCRAFTADDGGIVIGDGIWKNHWWILTESSSYMSSKEALEVIVNMSNSTPDVRPYLGMSLLDYFLQEVGDDI